MGTVVEPQTFLSDAEIGKRIRQLRDEAAERQVDLAEVLGLDQTAMSKIEKGARSVTARELVLLSQHYGVATATFIEPEATPNLRGGDAKPEHVERSLRTFGEHIDMYFGALALAQ